ncbi:hypothetical protein [Bifidobacterium tibiigranuli]|jgi:hypothetical protein|uniref:hypothetical protein n=1 Tax=Bifidobacterium tibiigranuli TaxID=2172043 RepID=UPI0026F140A4|nr:hypothetical protein [Bifidobacterium tibiigranuli]MCI1649747.1 hypothetical protein [Bifidobacterium tibiigranuli]MCI2185411.1 hypothetical protein [Bifidobacterium tibiigranuli]MCI2203614.1 hypothetical protein [Bifidobacterium tibiigranuli]
MTKEKEQMMALRDEQWQWDDSQAVESTEQTLYSDVENDLMLATGAADAREAVHMFTGRPRLSEANREETVQLQFKAPRSMADYVDSQRKLAGLHNKSEYLRMLVERDMRSHGQQLQSA